MPSEADSWTPDTPTESTTWDDVGASAVYNWELITPTEDSGWEDEDASLAA